MDQSLFAKYSAPQKKTRRTERGDLLEYITGVINRGREGTKYKPLTIKRVAMLLTGIPTHDLYYIKSQMEDCRARGTSPSKWFFWSIKQNVETTPKHH